MHSHNILGSGGREADVLGHLFAKGVRLWSEDGQLRYKAPKGALTAEDVEVLRASRSQLVALLEQAAVAEAVGATLEPRRRSECVPLAFSQLAHWHLLNLGERPSLRQIASATHIRGDLDADSLRASIASIIDRHEALRTRVVVVDGIPLQETRESCGFDL